MEEIYWRAKMKSISIFSSIYIGIVLICLLSSCMNRKTDFITGAQYFVLPIAQIAEYRCMADEGDANAAFRLYQHYAFGVADEVAGAYWLRKAAALGNNQAKQHLEVEAATEKSRAVSDVSVEDGEPANDPFQ